MKSSKKEINVVISEANETHCRQTEGSIAVTSEGRLLLAFTDFYDVKWVDMSPARIVGKWSDDEGESWTETFVLQENIGDLNVMCPSLLTLPSGRIILAFGRKDRRKFLSNPGGECAERGVMHLMAKYSDDQGVTWSEPKQITRENDDLIINRIC